MRRPAVLPYDLQRRRTLVVDSQAMYLRAKADLRRHHFLRSQDYLDRLSHIQQVPQYLTLRPRSERSPEPTILKVGERRFEAFSGRMLAGTHSLNRPRTLAPVPEAETRNRTLNPEPCSLYLCI